MRRDLLYIQLAELEAVPSARKFPISQHVIDHLVLPRCAVCFPQLRLHFFDFRRSSNLGSTLTLQGVSSGEETLYHTNIENSPPLEV